MPHFDSTVSLGSIISAVVFLIGIWTLAQKTYYSLEKRTTILDESIKSHTALLADHASRMERTEEAFGLRMQRQEEAFALRMQRQEETFGKRMEKQEESLLKIMQDVQRLLGRMEGMRNAMPRKDDLQQTHGGG